MDHPGPLSESPSERIAAAERALPDDRIIDGKYEVHGVLGVGGTGTVYDAVRKDDGRAVALKLMHVRLAGDAQIRGRFLREAAILQRLEGDHICPILELGEVAASESTPALLYMALAKIEGPTLERVLQDERPIAVDRALDVMLQICEALGIAHAQGVVHRDLKPANVILVEGRRAVVVDFGLSKIVAGPSAAANNLTTNNMVFGTPEYMSPEQAKGDELDARCDVYAAGAMLYEMLAGAPPFTGRTPLAVLTEHLTGVLEPPSVRADVGRVSPALDEVAVRALARDRDERYASAAALAAAIEQARANPGGVGEGSPSGLASAPSPGRADDEPAAVAASPVALRRNLTWLFVWIVAMAISIALGVYLALR